MKPEDLKRMYFFFNIAKFLTTVSEVTNALRLRLWEKHCQFKGQFRSSEEVAQLLGSFVSRLQDPCAVGALKGSTSSPESNTQPII